MLKQKLKFVGAHTLKYLIFLVAVMAWMIVLGPKETLTAEEQLYVQEFTAQAEAEPAVPTQVVSETPVVPVTPTAPSTAPAVTGNAAAPSDSAVTYGIILEDSVNVRSGPGLDYRAVMHLFKGNEVTLVQEMPGGWWKIAVNGSLYYIKSEFVTPKTMTGAN